jgi:hypothetical protein
MLFGELFPKNLAIERPGPMALCWRLQPPRTPCCGRLGIEPVHDVEHSATGRDLEHIVADSGESGDLPADDAVSGRPAPRGVSARNRTPPRPLRVCPPGRGPSMPWAVPTTAARPRRLPLKVTVTDFRFRDGTSPRRSLVAASGGRAGPSSYPGEVPRLSRGLRFQGVSLSVGPYRQFSQDRWSRAGSPSSAASSPAHRCAGSSRPRSCSPPSWSRSRRTRDFTSPRCSPSSRPFS